MKYILSRENNPQFYCDKYKDYYLLECETGRTLLEIGKDLHELLIMVSVYSKMEEVREYDRIWK